MTQDNLLEKLKAANNLVDKSVIILDRWCGEENRGSYAMAEHTWQCQDTFAGFIDMDSLEENYAKNLAKPNIRQEVEDRIKMIKSWRQTGI